MKREGRQHGMVRCHQILPDALNPRPGSTRYLNRFESPPTAGLFTRVPTKPTNHSKFTGKCGRPRCRECHESPVQKSKGKTKGASKLHLVTWWVTEAKLSGFSATELLDQMDGEDLNVDVHAVSCEIGSLAVDGKNCDEHECENDKNYDVKDHEEIDFETNSYVGDENNENHDEDEDWCFVEETL